MLFEKHQQSCVARLASTLQNWLVWCIDLLLSARDWTIALSISPTSGFQSLQLDRPNWSFFLQRSCSNFFAGRTIGAKKLSGSYTEVVKESIPLRVFGLSLRSTLKVNSSLSISHLSPNVHWTGSLSCPKSRSSLDGALSDSGIDSRTCSLLHNHLVSRNLPLERRCRSWMTNSMAHSEDLTNFTRSST